MESPLHAIDRQRRLLRMEYEAERNEFAGIAGRVGLERLASRGDAWTGISVGRVWYNSLNQRVVEVSRPVTPDDEGSDDHHFEYGRAVAFCVPPAGAGPDDKPRILFTGTVNRADGGSMVVAIPESADIQSLASAPGASVVLSFDETTYRAMFEALDRVANARGRLGELRDLFYSRRQAGRLSLAPMRFPYLNGSQTEAVNMVLGAKDVAVVHGPPGTGKTTTLVEAVNETLRREPQVLVCAQSNMAVDWICEKLVERGIHVLRLGNPSRVNDRMLSYTYERRFEDHPDYPSLWALRRDMRELQSGGRRGGGWHRKMDRLRARATELEIRINREIFDSAHVVASTLAGSGGRLLSGMRFGTVFIDEAAQALEAAAWIAIRRAGRVVLAGDHCQLPPTVKSREAAEGGLGRSLMERLVENHPEAVTMLTVQYRMNEDIMRFPSDWFYGGRMQAAPETRWRGILDLDHAIEWIDTSGLVSDAAESGDDAEATYREALAGGSPGRVNKAEARLTVRVLREYIERIGVGRFVGERIDVGLISPYRAQVRYLRSLIGGDPWFRPVRHQISVNTVDGFQGQERDIIVISMVRSNERGDIGFLRDLRRMNVAMTRARMKLLVIGDASTLCRYPFYRAFVRHILEISE